MLGGASTVRVASGLLVADNPPESVTTTANRPVDMATAKSLVLAFRNRNDSVVHRRKQKARR